MSKQFAFVTALALGLMAAGQAAATPSAHPSPPKNKMSCDVTHETAKDRAECYGALLANRVPAPATADHPAQPSWWFIRLLHRVGIGS